MASAPALIDRHGRTISYLRLSVTDRCDLRCRYCMAERMTFLPRDRLLSLEEIAIIAERFIARGVTKIRLTGGEPLVRRDVTELAHRLGRHRSEEHTSELQSLMRISYAVFCLKKKINMKDYDDNESRHALHIYNRE